jgi:hypothetical protein
VRTEVALQAGMYLVGCAYNFRNDQESLRWLAPTGSDWTWIERTPAMAAGLTGERWTMLQLLSYAIASPLPKAKTRRPRRSPSVERQELPLAA